MRSLRQFFGSQDGLWRLKGPGVVKQATLGESAMFKGLFYSCQAIGAVQFGSSDGYQGITYTKREKVLDIGPLQATAEKGNHSLPPILGR
jgi:hypothetical protein